jgi:hypothetical protein
MAAKYSIICRLFEHPNKIRMAMGELEDFYTCNNNTNWQWNNLHMFSLQLQ